MPFTKQAAFTKKFSDLPDVPSPDYTPTQIKEHIDTPPNELMTTLNNAIDKLNSTVDGNSGADNVGATGFDNTAKTVQVMLEDLNARKTDKTGDHEGTWQGFTPSQVDQTVRDQVNENTAQLAEMAHNVKSYGAKGDGVADDTTAIQDALVVAKQTKGVLYFPPGTYLFNQTIVIDSACSIKGAGRTATILQKMSDIVGMQLLTHKIVLQDFALWSGIADTKDGIQVGDSTIEHVSDANHIERVNSSKHGGSGIWLQNGNCSYLDVECNMNKEHGLRIENTYTGSVNTNEHTIRLSATGNTLDGLYVTNSSTNKILEIVTQGNHRYGFQLNSPHNTLFGYTEGNVVGSAKFGASGFSNFVIAKFNEGSPSYDNNSNLVMGMTPSATTLKMFGGSVVARWKSSRTVTLGTIPANSSVDFTIPNLYLGVAGDCCLVTPNGGLEMGLVYNSWFSANDTVTVRVTNVTSASVSTVSRSWLAEYWKNG